MVMVTLLFSNYINKNLQFIKNSEIVFIKIKFMKIIFTLFILSFSISYSSEFKIYDNNNSDLYVYIFLNENSCMTCQDYTYSFINKYKDNENLEIRIFYNGVSEDFYNENIKNKFLIHSVFDNFGLYSDYYNINNYPGFILLSKNGKEILNTDFLDDELILNTLDSLLSLEKSENHSIFNTSLLKDTPNISDNYKVKLFNNFIYILDIKYKKILIYNQLGELENKINFISEYSNFKLTYLFDFYILNKDEILLIDSDLYSNRLIVKINLLEKKITKFNNVPKNTENFNIGYNSFFDETDTSFIFGVYPNYNQKIRKLNYDDKTLLFLKNDKINYFGQSNFDNLKYKNSYAFVNYIIKKGNNIFEIQNLSTEILVYNKDNLKYEKSIKPKIDIKNFRKIYLDFEDIENAIYWNNIKNEISLIEGFYLDNLKKIFYIHFKNHNYPKNSNKPFDENNIIDSYLYSINEVGDVHKFNFNFGGNYKPILIMDDKIYVSENTNNKLKLYLIDINELN